MEILQKILNLTTPFSLKLAQELLQVYGSPLYVYDSDILLTLNYFI
jgi:diaminopimelate decarboxylase